ncbi:hypothetical protein [Shewanella xiamenensis]|uniref:hypothetical protein n=1 Tax=Shewanella xiamenensis TaxID=332186 RepID=UPI00068A19B7|nr:hypothetical protein [Shewanella xiamenensis]TVL13170.1 hypothetical protein AYI91_19455 [Shewanella xiamenensis]TVL13468.1 hypothetical protein AYI90_19460 [Shewanella xiamenensis]TVL21034.1 hypothetical protein AYI92_19615 [Shewanella xiamenensis]TVL26974.1 hypothetical protein AYI93_19480 [Shewanella xiamenensis]TVO96198.1 hypothetical protein AYI89_19285 [Shewanella xiamenensis]
MATPVFANATPKPALAIEQETFFNQLAAHCGKAFAGKVVSKDSADAAFRDKSLVMHVRECSDTELKIPFHVGDDHSRTWVITKTDQGLRLKHDHRHQDGTEDKVTMYGGDTASMGTSQKQSFPIDQASIDNFMQNGLTQSVTNVWHIEVTPNTFSYLLTREARHFQVDFDLTQPQPLPPVPWGHE